MTKLELYTNDMMLIGSNVTFIIEGTVNPIYNFKTLLYINVIIKKLN